MEPLVELTKIAESDPLFFKRCLRLAEPKLEAFYMEFGFDFRRLRVEIPDSEQGILACMSSYYASQPNIAARAVDRILEYIADLEEPARWLQKGVASLTFDDFPVLEHRINFEKVRAYPMRDDIFIPEEHWIDAIRDPIPDRKDYERSHVIRPEEFAGVVQRYGLIAVLGSCEAQERKVIQASISQLKDELSEIPELQKLHPRAIALMDPELYARARMLFGRYEWALIDLCGHSLRPSILEQYWINAHRLLVDHGEEAARSYLRAYKVAPRKVDRFIARALQNLDQYRGFHSHISTSFLEHIVEQELVDAGVFYRRQVPYKDIAETNKRYVADFVVGRVIIEVTSTDDCFIHDEKYWARMDEKKRLAAHAGYDFLQIDEDSKLPETLQAAIAQATLPARVYELESRPVFEPSSGSGQLAKIYTVAQIFYATKKHQNGPMISVMRKRLIAG